MAECKAVYKCRLCGEVYEEGSTGENIAQAINVALAVSGNTLSIRCGRNIYKHANHYCKDGSFGFADFQGFRRVGEE